MTPPGDTKSAETRSYVIGYIAALVITFGAFGIVRWHVLPAFQTLMAVFALALLQAVIHFRFFLHIDFKEQARDDLQLLLFSTLIIVLMVSGTVVILLNLRSRMM